MRIRFVGELGPLIDQIGYGAFAGIIAQYFLARPFQILRYPD